MSSNGTINFTTVVTCAECKSELSVDWVDTGGIARSGALFLSISVAPCSNCNNKAREEGYQEGYDMATTDQDVKVNSQ